MVVRFSDLDPTIVPRTAAPGHSPTAMEILVNKVEEQAARISSLEIEIGEIKAAHENHVHQNHYMRPDPG